MNIILASGSPRRKELLTNMGFEYDIVVSDCEEVTNETEPEKIVKDLSKLKALDVESKISSGYEDYLLIAADTLVFLENKRLGKPADEEDAKRMIAELSGKTHLVITGVTIISKNETERKVIAFDEITFVDVTELSQEEINLYVATKEPLDKAGAYAIQGKFAKHISGIRGDYSNVVGLPVARLYSELKNNELI